MGLKRPFMMFCILIIVICIARYYIYETLSPPEELLNEAVTLRGRIELWEVRNGQTILYLSDIYFYGDSAKEIKDYNSIGVRCYIEAVQDYKLGQAVAVRGFLTLPEKAYNPGEFNSADYYKSRGYDYIIYDGEVLTVSRNYDYLLEGLESIRQFAGQQLKHYLLPEDAGIMTAMLLGDKSYMAAETKDLYREVGIYHILAISGLHISMIGGLLFQLLKKIRFKPVLAVAISLLVIVMYGIMIGMPPSAFRAIVMFGFGLVAPLLCRSHDKLTSLAVTGACLAVWEPLLMFDAGVQLSFLAVLGIVALYPTFLGIHKYRMKAGDGLWISFAVTYMTLPVIMRTYYEVPIYSLFANVCVLPFVPVLIGLGIIIILFGEVWTILAQAAAGLIHMILWFYEQLLVLFTKLPGNSYITGAPENYRIILFYVVFGIFIWFFLKIKRKLLIRSLYSEKDYVEGRQQEYVRVQKEIKKSMIKMRLAQVIVMTVLVIMLFVPDAFNCRITFIDVGQGDGICIENRDEVYLIDCGSTSQDSVGKYIIEPFLKYKGIKEIDGWFLTHPDKDHTSAFTELCADESMDDIRIEYLYLPEVLEEEFSEIIMLAKDRGIEVVMLKTGDKMTKSGLTMTVLSPDEDIFYPDENSASLVLYMQYGKFDGLFMGDAGIEAEEYIMSEEIADITLLKVGHHGSSIAANTEDFIRQMNPDMAVISCGSNNIYGHPHKETLHNLNMVGSQIYITAENGALKINIE